MEENLFPATDDTYPFAILSFSFPEHAEYDEKGVWGQVIRSTAPAGLEAHSATPKRTEVEQLDQHSSWFISCLRICTSSI